MSEMILPTCQAFDNNGEIGQVSGGNGDVGATLLQLQRLHSRCSPTGKTNAPASPQQRRPLGGSSNLNTNSYQHNQPGVICIKNIEPTHPHKDHNCEPPPFTVQL